MKCKLNLSLILLKVGNISLNTEFEFLEFIMLRWPLVTNLNLDDILLTFVSFWVRYITILKPQQNTLQLSCFIDEIWH